MLRVARCCRVVGWLTLLPPALAAQVTDPATVLDPYPSQEVTFRHGDHVVSGTLHLPAAEGSHPGIILLAGSGATDRTSFGYFPYVQPAFLERGIAVLSYDKPGVGSSTGDWREMTLRDRADEAIAAVEFLRGHPAIREDQVGLWGGSQGGWVAPLAASRSEDVAFVIAVSAPGVPPAEQDVYGLETRLRRAGHPQDVVREGVQWGRRLMEAAVRGASFEEVRDSLLEPAEGRPWAELFSIPDAETWGFLAARDPETGEANVLYDPAPVLARTTTPLLAIFGADDDLVPIEPSVEILEDALRRAGNTDVTVVVFPDADHGIMVAPRTFAAGYLELMAEWVSARTGGSGSSSRGPFTTPTIVFLSAPEDAASEISARHAEEDYHVIMDDLNWYRSEAFDYLERQEFAPVLFREQGPLFFVVDRRVRRYEFEEASEWLDAIVAFRPGHAPQVVPTIDVHSLEAYFSPTQR